MFIVAHEHLAWRHAVPKGIWEDRGSASREKGLELRKNDENALPPVDLDKSRRIIIKKSQSASYWEILVNPNPKRFLVNTLYKNTNIIEKLIIMLLCCYLLLRQEREYHMWN